MLRIIVLIPLLIIAVLLVLFGVQNTQLVTISFLTYKLENLSLSLVIIVAAIFGAALVALMSLWGGIQRSLRQRRDNKERSDLYSRNVALQKRVGELERELVSLRGSSSASAPAKTPTK